jgi:hypothetical protein
LEQNYVLLAIWRKTCLMEMVIDLVKANNWVKNTLKNRMKPLQKMEILAACAVVALAAPAVRANTMLFSLVATEGQTVLGTGLVTTTEVSPGAYLATSGYFNLNAGGPFSPTAADATLVPTAGQGLWDGGGPGDYEFTAYGGTDLGFDDLIVSTGPGTYSLTEWGLLFNAPTGGPLGKGLAINPFLYGSNDPVLLYNGYGNNPWATVVSIDLTITDPPSVPDAGSTSLLLGFSLAGLGWVRHRMIR